LTQNTGPTLKTSHVAGLPIALTSQDQAPTFLAELADHKVPADIHLINAYTVALSDVDLEYRDLLRSAHTNLPDGRPLSLIGRFRVGRSFGQVRGPSLFHETLQLDWPRPLRHFLLGGTEESLAHLTRQIGQVAPSANVVGTNSPPFGPLTENDRAMIRDEILSSGANILWVGLGTPKQDYEVARLARQLDIPCVAVGAAFDFLAGTKLEAPRLLRRLGLEWLFRLFTEPRRLWRRYLIGNLMFLRAVARHWGAT
jgi:N-acetylglucosaminyldiphosphoundecaprenol N-acetyl-beta-D-mannosaminyltransferase